MVFNTRSRFLCYQFAVLIVFLLGVSALASLDLTLPIYIVLSAVPLLATFRSVRGRFTLIYFIIIGAYFLYGIIFQDMRATITTFCTRYYQFMVLMLLYQSQYARLDEQSMPKLLVAAVIMESVLNLFLIITGKSFDESESLRLVSGNQPVGGNLSVVILPVIIYCYFHLTEFRGMTIVIWSALFFWVLMSGTRGYVILFALPFVPVFMHYLVGNWQSKEESAKKLLILFSILMMLLLFLLVTGDWLDDHLRHFLRLGEGVGRRGKENAIALDTFQNTSMRYQIFGMGFGGTPRDVPGYEMAVYRVWGHSWGVQRYLGLKGVSFHSLYSNTLLIHGIIGCAMLLLVFLWGFRIIRSCWCAYPQERICLYLYWLTFFFINNYRWSCDCGIAEMIVLAAVVNQLTGTSSELELN